MLQNKLLNTFKTYQPKNNMNKYLQKPIEAKKKRRAQDRNISVNQMKREKAASSIK